MGYIRQVDIDVPIDRVWQAWTDRHELERWLAERANVRCEPGGAFELFWQRANLNTVGSRIAALEAPRRLVLDWQGTAAFADLFAGGGPTTVEVRLDPVDTGTRVTVEQPETRDVPGWRTYDEWMADAWEEALIGLKSRCEDEGSSIAARMAFADV